MEIEGFIFLGNFCCAVIDRGICKNKKRRDFWNPRFLESEDLRERGGFEERNGV